MPHSIKTIYLTLIVCFLFVGTLFGRILEVGAGRAYPTLQAAAKQAEGGDTILIREGIYKGGEFISNLKGTANAWITICAAPNETAVFRGGQEAIHLSDPEYVVIKDLVFTIKQQIV